MQDSMAYCLLSKGLRRARIPDLKVLGFALRLRREWLRRTDTNLGLGPSTVKD